ncbi:MAG TPA: hypothetical protein VJG13_11030 [Thermoanaerobaculia bacterium]|nr:hypothetical protein [Thermoanaerobaculia bacterium]HUP42828.1 hypothetical protein [Thermoanaerobaculia bacterium]
MSASERSGATTRRVSFDPTPEIFASDAGGAFAFPLQAGGERFLETDAYDECRLVFSVWHPSEKRSIDLDRAYVELRASFEPGEERWTRIAEIEPVVPPYGADAFDGWIVLPTLAVRTAFALHGAGFEPRSRIQIRGSAYFVP